MALSARDYLAQLRALLPLGQIWRRDGDSTMGRVMEVIATELARVDTRGDMLLREADPRRAVELLADWERNFGLPDPCVGDAQTQQDRRDALVSRMVTTGGQSRLYFIELCRALGYDTGITEFRPFRAGMAAAGNALTNGAWLHTWRVDAPAVTIRPFGAGRGAAGEPLRTWGNEQLECVVRRYAPAHTIVQFGYGGAEHAPN